jgi:hypothetical protein
MPSMYQLPDASPLQREAIANSNLRDEMLLL